MGIVGGEGKVEEFMGNLRGSLVLQNPLRPLPRPLAGPSTLCREDYVNNLKKEILAWASQSPGAGGLMSPSTKGTAISTPVGSFLQLHCARSNCAPKEINE